MSEAAPGEVDALIEKWRSEADELTTRERPYPWQAQAALIHRQHADALTAALATPGAGDAVRWLVESGPYTGVFDNAASAQAQHFELSSKGYTTATTPLYTHPARVVAALATQPPSGGV